MTKPLGPVAPDRGRGGRPRAPDPHTRVSTWLPERDYDRLVQLAKRRDQSVSSLVRSLLRLQLPR
jgi:hypothetical protein